MRLFNGDCLEVMKDIPDGTIDMILCDLPYGTTAWVLVAQEWPVRSRTGISSELSWIKNIMTLQNKG